MNKKILWALFLIYIAYLFFLTLAPFQFRPLQRHHFPWPIGPLRWDMGDIVSNIFLFLPFGFLTFFFPETQTPLGRGRRIALIACGVSFMIETLQIIVQGRFPSILDLFTNTLGGEIGFLLVDRQRNAVLHFCARCSFFFNIRRGAIPVFLVYSAFLLYLPFSWGEPFAEWGPDVGLMIGNNPKRTYPWNGALLSLAVYPRALGTEQIQQHYQEGHRVFSENALMRDALAFYTFEKPARLFQDRLHAEPPLALYLRSQEPSGAIRMRRDGLLFEGSTVLQTVQPESKRSERILSTKQLTVEAWFYAQLQSGAGGRLISFVNQGRTLWYLHQDIDEMIIGVRGSLLKRGRFHSQGIETLLLAPSLEDPVHLVGVYDPEQLFLFVNGRKVAEGSLTNGFFVLFNFMNLDRRPFGGRGLLGLALFWPFGLLLSWSLKNRSFSTLMTYGFWGGLYIGLILFIQGQHSILFFTSRTLWVPFCAQFLGMAAGEYLKRRLSLGLHNFNR